MSITQITKRIGYLAVVLGSIAAAGCDVAETSRRLPGGYRLIQKQQYQALYGPNGKPVRGEIDTDGDGRVDRWESFWSDGSLEKVDLDTNGDGKVDRTDYPQ